jgi:protein MpaA
VVPNTNPDGLFHGTRTNARGVDLNRNFQTRNWKPKTRHGARPLSEPESRFIQELITKYNPSIILSFHDPIACVDWDGPAEELARAFSEASGLPLNKLGTRPGSLGAYAGVDLGIPILTVELPGETAFQTPKEIWDRYGYALIKMIRSHSVDFRQ